MNNKSNRIVWTSRIKNILRGKKLIYFIFVVGVFLGGLLLGVGWRFIYPLVGKEQEKIANIPKSVGPTTNTSYKDKVGLVLIGHGGLGHSGGGLADTIIVVSFDIKTNQAKLISIPRDFAVKNDYTDGYLKKVNAIYIKGGENVKKIASEITGEAVDFFISVDFNQLQKVIDELGGIEVDVPVTFDDYFYPLRGEELNTCGKSAQEVASLSSKLSGFELEKQFECRYEHIHFDKGITQMKGSDALKFVRSRHSSQHGGDFARSERQFALLMGLTKKLTSVDAINNYEKVYDELKGFVSSDLTLELIGKVAPGISNPSEIKISSIRLSTENVLVDQKSSDGQYILLPKAGINNYREIVEYIKNKNI